MVNNITNVSEPWSVTHEPVIHIGNAFICLGLLAWNNISGMLVLHGAFVVGFLCHAVWGWVYLCALDVFSWSFAFAVMNLAQIGFILYTLLPTKFSPELEDIYDSVFMPLRVSRSMFSKLTAPDLCHIKRLDEGEKYFVRRQTNTDKLGLVISESLLEIEPWTSICYRSMFSKLTAPDLCRIKTLDEGEKYAVRRQTNTDKLGLVISGTVNVYNNHTLLHQVDERQFLDSPEFESNVSGDDKYQVTIVAVDTVRYIHWCKQSLDSLLLNEPYLGVIMGLLIGRDITNKLYALNEKAHPASLACHRPDIRLPSLASSHRSGTCSGDTHSNNLSVNASCASVTPHDGRSEVFPGEEPPQSNPPTNWEVASRSSAINESTSEMSTLVLAAQ